MNNFFKTALISIILCLTPLRVCAQEISADFVKSEVIQAVKKDLASKDFLDVDVKVLNLPFQSLSLPEGQVQLKLTGNSAISYSKRCIKTLQILVNGKFQYSFGVPLEINSSKMALVATKQINKDQSINMTNVILQKVEVGSNLGYIMEPKSFNGEVMASKLYRQGEFIDKRFVKIRADVERNEMVTVLFKMDGAIAVSMSGIALADGSVGDTIAVQNKENKRVYYGKVVSKNQVQINI